MTRRDANGILNVSAKDLGSGKDQNITITGSSGLDQDESIAFSVKLKHAEEDKNRKEAVELARLDNLVYQSEKQLKDNADKISEDNKASLEGAIEDAKDNGL